MSNFYLFRFHSYVLFWLGVYFPTSLILFAKSIEISPTNAWVKFFSSVCKIFREADSHFIVIFNADHEKTFHRKRSCLRKVSRCWIYAPSTPLSSLGDTNQWIIRRNLISAIREGWNKFPSCPIVVSKLNDWSSNWLLLMNFSFLFSKILLNYKEHSILCYVNELV